MTNLLLLERTDRLSRSLINVLKGCKGLLNKDSYYIVSVISVLFHV